ncbi:MAG TPA: tRNA epoxyqueuosine(34) reductase QueG [Candidatus Acidoferrales bacterium]|nr:tRNA epoxyqueuosine(34) reductase QueG [Candidatus Acidoferrales bacterium]
MLAKAMRGERTERLIEQARTIGFDLCGVARAEEFPELQKLPEWLARGYAGEMHYLQDDRRMHAEVVVPGARSVIVCALNYNTAAPYSTAIAADSASAGAGSEANADSPRGWISRYAWGSDYHHVLGPKLKTLLAWMRAEFGEDFLAREYVDTGPVLERVAAKYAGLGWLAKNTCLINQRMGSWLFLGVILTDLELTPSLAPAEAPPRDMCGTCSRCIDACPTNAFVEPYVLDARRCIAYLTIELRGPIPQEFRASMGSMVFGCDICQDVCPWNRRAPAATIPEFQPRAVSPGSSETLLAPRLDWLLSLTEEEYRIALHGSPVKRAKFRGLIRNACIAAGNSHLTRKSPAFAGISARLEALSKLEDAIIAEHARWALEQLRLRDSAPRSDGLS